MAVKNIALVSRNYFALKGLKELIATSSDNTRIIASVCNENELNKILIDHPIDIVMFVECNQDMTGVNWYTCLSELHQIYPEMKIILCSSVRVSTTSHCRGFIDAYLFLGEPLPTLHLQIKRIMDGSNKAFYIGRKSSGLSVLEWLVLKEVKAGARIQQIAERNNMPYRKVSALKNIAMRKLGLRNKTELLVFLTR